MLLSGRTTVCLIEKPLAVFGLSGRQAEARVEALSGCCQQEVLPISLPEAADGGVLAF